MSYLDQINARLEVTKKILPTDLVVGVSKKSIKKLVQDNLQEIASGTGGPIIVSPDPVLSPNVTVGVRIAANSIAVGFDPKTGLLTLSLSATLDFLAPTTPPNVYRSRILKVTNCQFDLIRDSTRASGVGFVPVPNPKAITSPIPTTKPNPALVKQYFNGSSTAYKNVEAKDCSSLHTLVPAMLANFLILPDVNARLQSFRLGPVFSVEMDDPEYLLLHGLPEVVIDPCPHVPSGNDTAIPGKVVLKQGAAPNGQTPMTQAPMVIVRYPKVSTLDVLAKARVALGLQFSEGHDDSIGLNYFSYSLTASAAKLDVWFNPPKSTIGLASFWKMSGSGEFGSIIGNCKQTKIPIFGERIDDGSSSASSSCTLAPTMDSNSLYLFGTTLVSASYSLHWLHNASLPQLLQDAIDFCLNKILNWKIAGYVNCALQVQLVERYGYAAQPFNFWDKSLSATSLLIGLDSENIGLTTRSLKKTRTR